MLDLELQVIWQAGRVILCRGSERFEMTHDEAAYALPRIEAAEKRARESMERFVDALAPAGAVVAERAR
jgi:hypothetical protein